MPPEELHTNVDAHNLFEGMFVVFNALNGRIYQSRCQYHMSSCPLKLENDILNFNKLVKFCSI